ncbi:MAG: DUF3617 family protein [Deltaproteobacteria bacterium]|nr:DUF3617 family protein [Deltaproteobacteria bacterium]
MSALLVPTMLLAAESGIKEGMWEITTKMEMPGMPIQMPETTIKHCYTKEDVKDTGKTIPKGDGDCRITDLKQSGNKVTWKMKCKGGQAGSGEGEMVFKGDSYEGTMKVQAEGTTMTTRYKGRRIGACP